LIAIHAPQPNDGVVGPVVPVVGSVLDPSFASFSVSYAPGEGAADGVWVALAGPGPRQVLRDTLAVGDVGGRREGLATLRLAVGLRTGKAVEDRRRVFVDRTPPLPFVHLLDDGLDGPFHAVVADVATDDLTEAVLTVRLGGRTAVVSSDRRARRHGLTWPDE